MTDKKNKKKNKREFIYMDDNDDEFGKEIVVNFSNIGESIKRSVNSTFKKFTENTNTENLPQTRNKDVCAQVPPDLSKAKTAQVFKYISFASIAILTLVFLIVFVENMTYGIGSAFVYFFLFLASLAANFAVPLVLDKVYKENLRLSNNYVRFLRELGNNTVISIRDLASAVAQSEEKTIDDLLVMMKRGYFKQARIVEDDSLFILDIPTFRLYKEKRNEIPQVRTEEDQYELSAEELSKERALEVINSGKSELAAISEYANLINDHEFSLLTSRITDSAKSILKIVEKYPDKSYALNKFSDYYLPTTAKLVETYHEFDMMHTTDPKIRKSMDDIRSSLVTIAEAFEKIKVELLSDRAMDIKTDIDTINLLLNQEGYTEDDWRKS